MTKNPEPQMTKKFKKAESLQINSVGQRHAKIVKMKLITFWLKAKNYYSPMATPWVEGYMIQNCALKGQLIGVNKYIALSGRSMVEHYSITPRRCHWAKLTKAFSLISKYVN